MKKSLSLLSLLIIGSGVITGCNCYKDEEKNQTLYLSGTSIPSDNEGENGKYYLNTTNKDLYYKVDGKWIFVSNIDVNNRLKAGNYIYSKKDVVVTLTINDKEEISNLVVTGKDGYTSTCKVEDHLIVITLTKENVVETLTLGGNGESTNEGKFILVDKYSRETKEKLLKTFTGKSIDSDLITISLTLKDETSATFVYKDERNSVVVNETYNGTYTIHSQNGNKYTILFEDDELFIIEIDVSDISSSSLAYNPLA